VDCSLGGEDAVAPGTARTRRGVGVDDCEFGGAVCAPEKFAFVFGGYEGAVEHHCVSGSTVGPGVGLGHGDGGGHVHCIRCAVDVEVELEIQNVVVHGAGKGVVDLVAIFGVVHEVGRLNIPRGADFDMNAAVKVKAVSEYVIVVAHGTGGPDIEEDILRGTDII
jgi:hypothetical protein